MIVQNNLIEINNKGIINNIFTMDQLYTAYINCKKGKKSINTLKFEENIEENLFKLLFELNNDTYEISRALCFVVIKPKIREIWASDFRDRVIHHLITRKIESFYETKTFPFSFLNSSYANRKEKGTLKAVKKLENLIKTNSYYLKLDIESFFNAIDRTILLDILNKDLKLINFENKQIFLNLFKKISSYNYTKNYTKKSSSDLFKLVPFHKSLFSSESKNKGLPIGNLTSQFLSNVYLNKLDYFVQKELKFKNYIRYVDDFIILSNNKDELKGLIQIISIFLKQELGLNLHPKKIILNQTKQGIDFLGYYIKPKYTLVRKNVVQNLKEKLYLSLYDTNSNEKKRLTRKEVEKLQNIVNSYFGHFKHAKSHNLKYKMTKKLDEYFNLEKKLNNSEFLKLKNSSNFKNVFEQYTYFLNKYENSLIIFQMGNFYRFFNSQAEYISKKITLKTQIRKYSNVNHIICGFPLNSKKLQKIKDLNINYCIIKQLDNQLTSGLKERIEDKLISNLTPLEKLEQVKIKYEDLNQILKWDLNKMTPIDVFTKLNKLIKSNNK